MNISFVREAKSGRAGLSCLTCAASLFTPEIDAMAPFIEEHRLCPRPVPHQLEPPPHSPR